MARRDALVRLHQRLTTRRDALRRTLAGELDGLQGNRNGDLTGDAADAAFGAGSGEVSSQLAQMESRELKLIERAIGRMKKGNYGTCEGCGKKIPVARLNALPYSAMCVSCQEEAESHGGWAGDYAVGDWENVNDSDSYHKEARVNFAELEAGY